MTNAKNFVEILLLLKLACGNTSRTLNSTERSSEDNTA
jgi:hypothetical protein